MKKTFTLLMISALTACTAFRCDDVSPVVVSQPATVVEPVLVEAPAPVCPCQQALTVTPPPCAQAANMPCAQVVNTTPCGCALPDPCREIQKPRITEVVVEAPRRRCPVDGQMINCGMGNQKTFEQVQVLEQKPSRVVVPAMPQAYVLASNRVVSRFLKDASSVYAKGPNLRLFVKPAQALSDDLPKGVKSGSDNFKKQIASSYTFDIVETLNGADYYLETTANWFDTPSKSVPAIEYKSVLYDKNNNKIKEWVEIIKKADNTQSWL